jgi:hypothetical protein
MPINKKTAIVTCLFAVVTFSAMTAMKADDDDHGFKNLKVLPKKISEKQLHSVMHEWSQSLGVKCGFCHANGADGKLDFASDAKPEKEMARDMFKMEAAINKKYFKAQKDTSGFVVGDMKCYTCHRGDPHPDDAKLPAMDMHRGPGMGGPGPVIKHDSVPPPPPSN